ncbi:hypothetical protein C6379_25620 [Pseudomonas syringae pv. actinidiae]|nr:hypothetical protein C6379_25620 [Pseudomonas syringae pv. actinidiae]
MPTRSVGTIVFLRTPIVPHAPAWECISGRSASNLDQRCGEVCDAERQNGMPTRSVGTIINRKKGQVSLPGPSCFAARCQSIALAILACSSAWYDERTSGPEATFLKPIL